MTPESVVFIVDDDISVRDALRTLIRSVGLEARTFTSAAEFLNAALPDVPTTVELGYPDMIMENWYGLLAPAGLAPDVASKLEAAALTAIKSPKIQQHIRDGELRGTLNSQEFKARIERDIAFWRPMIKQLGISMAN